MLVAGLRFALKGLLELTFLTYWCSGGSESKYVELYIFRVSNKKEVEDVFDEIGVPTVIT